MKRDERTRQHADASTVSLWLDAYTDIFSDFDPRPFAERAISDDFILQVRRLARDSNKVAVLRLLLPEGAEREEHERTIRKRLHDYFERMYDQLDAEARAARNKGVQMVAAGVAMMVVASYIYYRGLTQFSHYLLLVLLEPGGWFLFWSGLDNLLTFAKAKKRDILFYSRMAAAHVEFGTYKP
ncbi:MAG: hypothetical protein SV422_16230 [Pseudomonadota bacterium]|nr:hypothetical protein [Pseudomonadota bacterium]